MLFRSRIFRLTIEGKGPYDIARILFDDKIETPAVYAAKMCIRDRADGDVIDFTARLFGLNKKEAALKLAEDFSVGFDAKGHDPPRRKPVKRKISEELRYRQAEQKCFRVLCDYLHLLERWEKEYAPQTLEEAWNPLFVEALQKKPYTEYLLDILLSGSMAVSYTHLGGAACPAGSPCADVAEKQRIASSIVAVPKLGTTTTTESVSYTHLDVYKRQAV